MFVGHGTTRNDVRQVFEQYEPKVDLRVTQKGNVLNKSNYVVMTFRNKALGLHAAMTLEGTDQRDLLGVNPLHLSMMLTREEQRIVKRLAKRRSKKAAATA